MSMATNHDGNARKATPLRVAKAVFWSFFGVRRESDLDRDAITLRPVQVIIGGLLGAALVAAVLISIAHFVTR